MSLSFSDFRNEVEKYCKVEGFATDRYDEFERNKIHAHMYSFVANYYGNPTEIMKVCREYENRFWREHIH